MKGGAVIFVSCAFLAVFTPSSAVDSNCDYQQNLEIGKNYYVYNPGYPNSYQGRWDCRWTAQASYRVELHCTEFELPATTGCSGDHLSVTRNTNEMNRYCGTNQFSVVSDTDTMVISFQSLRQTYGGKFLCRLRAVKKVEYNDNCTCGYKYPSRIIGGEETGVNEYPMMAGIVDIEKYKLYCGGTIISVKHVLTAAHCLRGRDFRNLLVLIGDHDTSTNKETNVTKLLPIEKVSIHPDYVRSPAINDIAIITLGRRIQFNMRVGPACLPFQHSTDFFAGNYVELIGWGLLSTAGRKPDALQKVKVSVPNPHQCRQDYSYASFGHICNDGYNMMNTCQEDSGGPMLWMNPTTDALSIIGVISTGRICDSNSTSVNTRVGAYLNWIVTETPDIDYCTTG